MSLGTRIRECRLKSGLSQEKMAELVGVSRQAVTKWESDQSAPSTDNLFKLADVLGTTVDFLITTEADSRSVAEQVYRMLKDEEARKEAERKQQKRLNLRTTLAVICGYLALFLLGKLLWCHSDDYTFLGWLTTTYVKADCYLFGWLLNKNLFFCSALLTIFLALKGWRRTSIVSFGGFVLGLFPGEWVGGLPQLVTPGYHFGWAIWGGIFFMSLGMGIRLQRFQPEEMHFRSRKMRLWCILYAALVIGVIAFVLLNIPPYARA